MMVKRVFNKAYTLLEMLFVLLVISVMLISLQPNQYLKMLYLKALIEKAQVIALTSQQKVYLKVEKTYLVVNQMKYDLGISCLDQSFHFNQDGNISNGLTIQCSGYKLVLQLGSGVSEIR